MAIAVHTTVATAEEARDLARALVGGGLAACAQIHAIESHYVWEGELREEREHRVLLKCADGTYPAVERAIRERHPYDLPAIWATRVDEGSAEYLAWVEANSRGEA